MNAIQKMNKPKFQESDKNKLTEVMLLFVDEVGLKEDNGIYILWSNLNQIIQCYIDGENRPSHVPGDISTKDKDFLTRMFIWYYEQCQPEKGKGYFELWDNLTKEIDYHIDLEKSTLQS